MPDTTMSNIESSILVVDDQPQNTEVLAITLELEGYQVKVAHTGEEALRIACEQKPGLILLDILMPGMNGFEVCTQLKANPDTTEIPVIFVSALSDSNDRIKAFYAGGVDYIGKPFNLNEVVARISTHMSLRRNQIENSLLRQQLESQNERLGEIVNRRTKQLNHLNRRMGAILASITDAIILLDKDSTIDITNPAFSTMLGYYPDELFGKPILRIIQPEYHDMIKTAFDAACEGDTQHHIQVEAVHKNGTKLDVDLTFSTVNDEEGHILCNCHDITYIKEMERIKDNFISMVTHELRTPVANILLTANQFKRYLDRMTQEQLVRKIDQLDVQAHILVELIESVLDISRLQSQSAQLSDSREPVNMLEIVQGVVEELEHAANEKEQNLRLIYDELPGVLYGEVVDFSRLWRNLISNAVKYTRNGGEIIVRLGILEVQADNTPALSSALLDTTFADTAQLEPGIYCIGQVEDNGHGIAEEHQQQLFKRFHRGWAKESSIPGTGLGLALVKEQLALYNGDIHFKSAVGQGTTFTFWLPLEHEIERS